jgi:hypothetical protein
MTRRIIIWGILALLTAALAIVVAAQQRADLPPGVAPDNWIAINPNIGIALNNDESRHIQRYSPAGFKYGKLMVRSHGSWVAVYLDPAPHGFMPVTR